MPKAYRLPCWGIILFMLLVITTSAAENVWFEAGKTDVTFNGGMKGELSDGVLQLSCGTKEPWPGITLSGQWSLEASETLVLELINLDKQQKLTVNCRLDSPGANADRGVRTCWQAIELDPGETKRCMLTLPARLPPQLAEKLFGMRGYPGGAKGDTDGKVGSGDAFDPANVVRVTVYVAKPQKPCRFGLKRITQTKAATGGKISSLNDALTLPPEKFFPMIDRYGQYKHADWPGKIMSDGALKRNIAVEDADLEKHPGPSGWNQYGGWTAGPHHEATGRFRVMQVDGRWWFVDPEGCLFWSHGTNCIRPNNAETPVADREFWFEEFPGNFYGRIEWVAHGYYKGKLGAKTYNFTASNLRLKYGDDWRRLFDERAHRRLRSWGMNTIGNWSDRSVYDMKRTPYTATLSSGGPPIAGSSGYWGQFKDPFHTDFRKSIADAVARRRAEINDPWCLGAFVDNEIAWGDDTSLAVAALVSPASQPAKIALVASLKKKYDTIAQLNAIWGTTYADWNALLASSVAPGKEKAKEDLQELYSLIAEQYFAVIREEFKKVAPDTLYFGCRFAWVNDRAVRAAANYCDVLSFNKYEYTLDGFKLPGGVDKGVVIGEFHFGALDRGLFHAGLKPTESQEARAAAYQRYVTGALKHPQIIGTHWFLYGDQATTGRGGDGENYQIGLLDVADTPYAETIEAVRDVGKNIYSIRQGNFTSPVQR